LGMFATRIAPTMPLVLSINRKETVLDLSHQSIRSLHSMAL
jgi:hypothetical protein